MKIISWNLKNIGTNKLPKEFAAVYSAYGLGGSCLDFITKVVTGDTAWDNIQSDNPADVFVIIELKSGGNIQGLAGTSSCLVVLPRIVNAMNTIVAAGADAANYSYAAVPPLITGYHETVGIIYNTKALTLKSKSVPPNSTTNKGITPRGPFFANFELTSAAGGSISISGIHAPPPQGSGRLKYRKPIDFNRLLVNTGIGNGTSFILGDFNCNPGSFYPGAGAGTQVKPFTNLNGFRTNIADGTLSSVRMKLAPANPPPANYLSDSFDNILFNMAAVATPESVMDLIGNARNMNGAAATDLNTVFTAYKVLSDHLPVIIEY